MNKGLHCFLIFLTILYPGIILAQTMPVDTVHLSTDSVEKKTVLGASVKMPAVVTGQIAPLQNKLTNANPSKQVNQIKNAAKSKVKQVNDAFGKSLDKVKSRPVTVNVSVEDAVRYQPALVVPVSAGNPKLANNVYLQGTVQVFGIPLNLNYSNDRAAIAGLNNISNNLFKFDFNPAQFTEMFKSDLQQYYDVRRSAFGGLDLAGYTRNAVMAQIKKQENAVTGKVQNQVLSQYLNNPGNITSLLSLNESQIRQKLAEVAQSQAKQANPVKQLNDINPAAGAPGISQAAERLAQNELKSDLPANLNTVNTANPLAGLSGTARKLAEEKMKTEAAALKELVDNPEVKKYLSDPQNLKQLRQMNEQQIVQKLSVLTGASHPAAVPNSTAAAASQLCLFPGVDMNGLISNVMADKAAADNKALVKLAQQVSQQGNPPAASAKAMLSPNKEIDSVTHTIVNIKESLQKSGVDVNKMLQIQKMLDSGNGVMPSTEQAASLAGKKAGTGMQSLFSNVQALKLGSFGNQVPGGIQGQDLFMDGAHVTYKLGSIPVTAGYGTSNDISSAKDAAYQSSMYSSPKTITYLGAQIRRGVFGNVKIAMVSSFGSDVRNTAIGIPATSSNNVAFTITKDMRLGKLGNLSVDVSKSTTLYNNNYQIGSDAILAQKAGVNLNTTNDLFEAVGFGVNHQLDIKALDMSDNIYFNYTGMGYQNPGNNGYGGARKKMGGSIKKSFYKNKLVLNLRTDVSGMPISYTSSDQWRSYQVQLDSRYVVNKKFNLSLKYATNGTSKQIDEVVTPVYTFSKLQIDGNINYKIGKNFTVSHFSIGKQDYSNVTDLAMAGGGGSMIMATYTQSMVINRNSLTATMFYNKELTPNSLIGNMFNADMSYQYTVFNKLNLSSGLTYLNNAGIASQAGIRQSVQLFSSKSFDMNSYVDIRKNLVTPLYPELYSACRAELSLKYHIRN